jgi:signal transduction histidine kinase
MLDVTRIDSQTLTLCPELTNLLSVVRRVQAEFEPALHRRQLSLTLDRLDHLPDIWADPEFLYKVFYHLIVNAIKYTPDGGAITVSGATDSGEAGQPVVELVVRDTGIGIDPDHHELIFEKFYQTGEVAVHSSGRTKFKGGGPGLGLAIARGIVQAHGGKIWVESPGYDEDSCPGSRFHVRLLQSSTNGELI